jgi:hypothetical protein
MSNLGLHFVYSALSATGSFRVERRFLDSRPREVPDAFFFTVSYEEDLLNIVRILEASGVEPLGADREGGPIVGR